MSPSPAPSFQANRRGLAKSRQPAVPAQLSCLKMLSPSMSTDMPLEARHVPVSEMSHQQRERAVAVVLLVSRAEAEVRQATHTQPTAQRPLANLKVVDTKRAGPGTSLHPSLGQHTPQQVGKFLESASFFISLPDCVRICA